MDKSYSCIVLVTDGTESSHAAEETAANLALQHSARIVVVGTMRPPSFASQMFGSHVKEAFEKAIADTTDRLERITPVSRDAHYPAWRPSSSAVPAENRTSN